MEIRLRTCHGYVTVDQWGCVGCHVLHVLIFTAETRLCGVWRIWKGKGGEMDSVQTTVRSILYRPVTAIKLNQFHSMGCWLRLGLLTSGPKHSRHPIERN